ncbi:MFS transporter [Longispora sp. NPDC051575]|uniref:MFS transporter n=1 Tax=Longispora sp. NPDC051575 TaxID=3154943 RepID=UPI0034139013
MRPTPELGPARSLLLVLFTFLTLTLVQVVVPLRLDDLHVDAIAIGALLALPSLTGLIAETPFAAISDAVGRRAVISLGAVMLLGSSALMALADAAWVLALALILYGVGLGAQTSALMAALSESVPPERSAHLQGWNGAVQRIGAMGVAGLVVVTSEPSTLLWFVGVASLACLGLAAAVPHWRFGEGQRRPPWRQTYAAAFGVLRRSSLVQAGAMYNVLLSVLFITTNSFVALILVTTGNPLPLAALLLVRDLTSVLLASVFGNLAAALGWRRCFLIGMVAGTTAMLIGVLIPADSPWMYILFGLCGITTGFGIAGANLAVTYGTDPAERALGMVAAGYAGRLASLVAPIVLAFAFSRTAAVGVFAVSLAAAASVTIRAVWILRRRTSLA